MEPGNLIARARLRILTWVVPAVVILVAGAILLVARAQASDTDADIDSLFRAGEGQESIIVATVNGKTISEQAVQQRMRMMQLDPLREPQAAGDLRQTAIDLLVRRELLLIAADDLGLAATSDEAAAFALENHETLIASDDPAAARNLQFSADSAGVSVEDFPHDPRVIAAHQRFLTLGRVREYVWLRVPGVPMTDDHAIEAALTELADAYRADVEVVILRP